MKRILVIFAAALTIVCTNPLESWALQPCPIFDPPNTWTNCIGKKKVDLSSTYNGGFKNGKFHGKGTLTRSDGTIQKGHWKNGALVVSPSLKNSVSNQQKKSSRSGNSEQKNIKS